MRGALLGRGLLAVPLLLVSVVHAGLPSEQVVAQVVDLPFGLLPDDVVPLVGVLGEVVVLLAAVAVGVDVLLVPVDARQARALVVAAHLERPVLRRREDRVGRGRAARGRGRR